MDRTEVAQPLLFSTPSVSGGRKTDDARNADPKKAKYWEEQPPLAVQ
jgi:hypothetical protein